MSKFRERLVAELSRLHFAAGHHAPEKILAQSKKLGVLPEVLLEACLLRKERATATGLRTLTPIEYFATHRDKLQQADIRILSMFINQDVMFLIKEEVARRQVDIARFIRAIVHFYLMSEADLPALYPSWAEIVPNVKGGKTVNLTKVPYAAVWVMTYRAERLRCSFNTLLRTLIINTLRAGYAQHHEVQYTYGPRGLPQNIHEYPGFSEAELDAISDNMQTDVLNPVWRRKGFIDEKRVGRGMRLPDGNQLKVYPKGPYNWKKKPGRQRNVTVGDESCNPIDPNLPCSEENEIPKP